MLVPKLRPFHCSKPGVGHTLTLKCDDEKVVVTHIVVHAAAMCSAPLRRGELWVTSAAFSNGSGEAAALTRVPFECPKDTMQYVYNLPQPIGGGVTIGIKLIDTWHDEQPNVDLGMVAIVGHSNGSETADALSAAAGAECGLGPVPRSLKVTNLIRVVQRKKWMPLESDREILTSYLHRIGFPKTYCFHDVLGFEDWAFEMVPGPVLALVLLFPVTKETEAARKAEAESIEKGGQTLPQDPPLLHIRQNIGNACGTIGLLHAACHALMGNELAGGSAVPPESWLGKFIAKANGLDAEAAGDVLEDDVEIEEAHAAAEAASHDSAARTQNVHNHFTAIVQRCVCSLSLFLLVRNRAACSMEGSNDEIRFARAQRWVSVGAGRTETHSSELRRYYAGFVSQGCCGAGPAAVCTSLRGRLALRFVCTRTCTRCWRRRRSRQWESRADEQR